VNFLNYHHLRYFRAVAHERNLTKAAKMLHISQSALSIQLKKLEQSLGHELFLRQNNRLQLTDTGRIVLDFADSIFRTGDELLTLLDRHTPGKRRTLTVGAVATLSRNFQLALLQPLMSSDDVEVIVRSGSLRELLIQQEAHNLDLILSNLPVPRETATGLHSHLLAEQPVSLVGRKMFRQGRRAFRFPEDLDGKKMILPSFQSNIRTDFDLIIEQACVRPKIIAEIDDMAMLRLFAREADAIALVPPVVVRDELRSKQLIEFHRIAQIRERFYAITPSRRFPNDLIKQMLGRKLKMMDV
jgi:LysR family transcriptional regulator, transcriptional activator of nhaA